MGQGGWRAVRGKHDVRLVQRGPAEPESPRKKLGFLLSAVGSHRRVEGWWQRGSQFAFKTVTQCSQYCLERSRVDLRGSSGLVPGGPQSSKASRQVWK